MGFGQRAGWRGGSGYTSGALGLLSCWFGSKDVRHARVAARPRATRFQPEHVRSTSSAPLGQPLWQGARGSMADAAARGCPGRSQAGGGASRRSNRSSETTRVLSESQSRRCCSFADGSPHVRAMRSPSDLARGDARDGRRARLNLMRPCRLGPKSAEPNTYSEPPKSAFCRSSPQPTYRRPQWARIPISVRKSLLGTLNTGEFLPELRGTSRCSLRQGLAQNHARGAPLTQSKTSTQKRMCTIPTAGKDQSQSSV